MSRRTAWIEYLEAYLWLCSQGSFGYGAQDCFLFVSGAVRAMTGIDPAARYRGRYRSRAQARALLKEAGGYSAVFQNCGMKEIPMARAQRGDVVQLSRFGLGLMALDGQRAYTVGEEGLVLVTPQFQGKAWRA